MRRSWPGGLLFAAYWSSWSCIILHMGGYDTGPTVVHRVGGPPDVGSLCVCTVPWLGVNVLSSLWSSLCLVKKCLNIISVGHKVYLPWVHFSTVCLSQLMSAVTTVSVYWSLYHCSLCIHFVFHSGRLLGSSVLHTSLLMFTFLKVITIYYLHICGKLRLQ